MARVFLAVLLVVFLGLGPIAAWAATLPLPKGQPVRVTLDNERSREFTFTYNANGPGTVLLRMIEKIGGGSLGQLRRTHQIQAGTTTVREQLQGGRYIAELTFQSGTASSVSVSGNLTLRPVQ